MGAHTSQPDIRAVLDSIRRIVSALRLFDRDAESRAGISGAQLFVLRQLHDTRGMSVNELANRTHTHQSSVSVVVEKLARRGLVRRENSRLDGRRVELSLSEAGKRLLRRAPAAAQERMISALAAFPRGKRQMLSELLAELIRKTGIQRNKSTMFFEDKHPRPSRRR